MSYTPIYVTKEDCNFTYSLLGIETIKQSIDLEKISNCNFTYSLLGIETSS